MGGDFRDTFPTAETWATRWGTYFKHDCIDFLKALLIRNPGKPTRFVTTKSLTRRFL